MPKHGRNGEEMKESDKRRRYQPVGKRMRNPVKRKALSEPGAELKFVDRTEGGVNYNTTTTIALLNGVAVGDDFNTRDGRQIRIKSVRVILTKDTQITAGGDFHFKIWLVWDNQPNGATPAFTDIFTNNATSLTFPNLNNQKRFTILREKEYIYSAIATNGSCWQPSNEALSFYHKMDNVTQYLDTGATIASISTGALFLVTAGNVAAAVTGGPTGRMTARVRFTDK